MYQINTDSGKYCFGYKSTLEALECGAVEDLIIYEDLELQSQQLQDFQEHVQSLESGDDFVDWIAEHYKEFGCRLHFVSAKSGEGAQFVEGFGGIGAILRYKMENLDPNENDLEELSSFSEDEDIF